MRKKFEDKMDSKWLELLWPVLSSDNMKTCFNTIRDRKKRGIFVYPSFDNAFRAFKLTPFDKVKVVILGQDPYHDGSATGLAFANREDTLPPLSPSLRNIWKEVENEYDMILDFDPTLQQWAEQGVLLLNTALTVEKGKPESHAHLWGKFTESVLKVLSTNTTGIIYFLWGTHAKSYRRYINEKTNHILEAAHPVAECYRKGAGFFGCGHFKRANEIIQAANGKEYTINWEQPGLYT